MIWRFVVRSVLYYMKYLMKFKLTRRMTLLILGTKRTLMWISEKKATAKNMRNGLLKKMHGLQYITQIIMSCI